LAVIRCPLPVGVNGRRITDNGQTDNEKRDNPSLSKRRNELQQPLIDLLRAFLVHEMSGVGDDERSRGPAGRAAPAFQKLDADAPVARAMEVERPRGDWTHADAQLVLGERRVLIDGVQLDR
jgi:hypothetical protein